MILPPRPPKSTGMTGVSHCTQPDSTSSTLPRACTIEISIFKNWYLNVEAKSIDMCGFDPVIVLLAGYYSVLFVWLLCDVAGPFT